MDTLPSCSRTISPATFPLNDARRRRGQGSSTVPRPVPLENHGDRNGLATRLARPCRPTGMMRGRCPPGVHVGSDPMLVDLGAERAALERARQAVEDKLVS